MEFRFGIHNLHSTINHLSVTGEVSWLRYGASVEIDIIMSTRNYFSQLEKDIILRIVISSFRKCKWVKDRVSRYGFSAYPESPSKILL